VHRTYLFFPFLLAAAGCLAEEPAVRSPVNDEAPPPAEHVVLSAVTMTAPADGQPPAPSAADRVRPGPVFFRLGAGYGAVGRVDLSTCRDRGLDPGYVHLHVTFEGNGAVARAAVESPTQPPPDALACIGERLEAAAVPAFEGGNVTLSKSLYIAGGGQPPADVIVKERAAPELRPTASR
jgi:hypothetical protein